MNPTAATTLDLRDIHAAAEPAVWPPAPGWWVLAVLTLVVLVIGTLWLLRRYRAYRLRHQIMNELNALGSGRSKENTVVFLSQLSILLRRIALRRYAREQVASLTGSDWLRFLDATGGNGEFEHGVGQILEVGPYCPHDRELPAEELLLLARRWVKQNLKVAA
ncbi:MAG: DUF4381 domain-containing protein [Gammaproteobacteria bacterium]